MTWIFWGGDSLTHNFLFQKKQKKMEQSAEREERVMIFREAEHAFQLASLKTKEESWLFQRP